MPEGSEIRWKFETEHAENIFFQINDKEKVNPTSAKLFEIQKTVYKSSNYGLFVGGNKLDGDSIFYQLKVVPDAFPSIKLVEIIDSNDNYLRFFEGVIQDDYGFTSLTFNYRIVGRRKQRLAYRRISYQQQ